MLQTPRSMSASIPNSFQMIIVRSLVVEKNRTTKKLRFYCAQHVSETL